MTYQLQLLGRFHLSAPDGSEIAFTAKKNQAFLAILAVAAGGWVPRSRLCDLLWQGRGEDQARNSLRQALAALRRSFVAHNSFPLKVNDDAVAIDQSVVTSDIQRLNGSAVAGGIDGLIYGEFLEGLSIHGHSIEDWLLSQRRRFNTAYCDALTARIAELDAVSDHQGALASARTLLDADSLNENAHRAVIRLLAECGERSAALKHYQTCCGILKAELGIAPQTATTSLYEAIRNGSSDHASASQIGGGVKVQTELPGIVVLPFANLSGDPEQDYFSNGLTDSITSELSRFHDLFVISGTSAFTYQHSNATTAEICGELGVQYVLEGSVQQAAERLRINTQLVDGLSGRQLWAERYDRLMDDLFIVQDDVTGSIVAALATTYGGRLRKAWQHKRRNIKPADVKAFDLVIRAVDRLEKSTIEDIAEGRKFLRQAIALDPECAKAHAKLGWTYVLDAVEGWGDDYEANMAEAAKCATQAIRADDGENWAHWLQASLDIFAMRHDLGIAGYEKTLKLNPNDADVLIDYGYFLSLSGRAAEGLVEAGKAIRLNPHSPDWYTVQLMQIHFDLRDYHEAIAAFARLQGSITPAACLYLAASHAALGEMEKANAAIERALIYDPAASIQKWTDTRMLPYRKAEDMAHLRDNLQAAGLPA